MKTLIAAVCLLLVAVANSANAVTKDVLSHMSCRYLRLHRYCAYKFIKNDLCSASCECKDILSEYSCKVLLDQGKCNIAELANDCKLTCDKCPEEASSGASPTPGALPTPGASPTPPCVNRPLGMESGQIPDASITSSSDFKPQYAAKFARLNGNGSWVRGSSERGWIQVDLGKPTKIVAIATQGYKIFDSPSYMGSYSVEYSFYGNKFTKYLDGKVLPGNTDSSSVKKNILEVPFTARYVRILPEIYKGFVSIRLELYGPC